MRVCMYVFVCIGHGMVYKHDANFVCGPQRALLESRETEKTQKSQLDELRKTHQERDGNCFLAVCLTVLICIPRFPQQEKTDHNLLSSMRCGVLRVYCNGG